MDLSPCRSLRNRCGVAGGVLSIFLWIGVVACYAGGWEGVAVVTMFPFWLWALAGGVLSYAAGRLLQKRRLLLLAALWVGSSLWFADDLRPLIRPLRSDPVLSWNNRSRLIRVVTLNCSGKVAAATEVGAFKPDIVLLQEIPSTNELVRLCHEWFGAEGAFVAGLDCAILARGPLRSVGDCPAQYTRALLQRPDGTVLVTSLRLVPPAARLDLWNPSAWSASTTNCRLRRDQMRAALRRQSSDRGYPEIFGGDFNAPVWDTVFRLLDEFADAHRQAGRGWGNTVLNGLPIARPDRIWLQRMRAISARSCRTRNSDHRLVVADIVACDQAPY